MTHDGKNVINGLVTCGNNRLTETNLSKVKITMFQVEEKNNPKEISSEFQK